MPGYAPVMPLQKCGFMPWFIMKLLAWKPNEPAAGLYCCAHPLPTPLCAPQRAFAGPFGAGDGLGGCVLTLGSAAQLGRCLGWVTSRTGRKGGRTAMCPATYRALETRMHMSGALHGDANAMH